MTSVASYLETLVRESQNPETEVIAMALQAGLRQLWRERTLGRCFPRGFSVKVLL
jgi:hypothetical protein